MISEAPNKRIEPGEASGVYSGLSNPLSAVSDQDIEGFRRAVKNVVRHEHARNNNKGIAIAFVRGDVRNHPKFVEEIELLNKNFSGAFPVLSKSAGGVPSETYVVLCFSDEAVRAHEQWLAAKSKGGVLAHLKRHPFAAQGDWTLGFRVT